MSRSTVILFSVPLVAILAGLPALAAEGRTPIFVSGTVIGADGSYVVTRPLTGGGGPIVTVTASKVEIDLNGMVLTNLGAASPIISIGAGADHVIIRNGTLAAGSIGIEAPGPTRKVDVEDVTILDMVSGAGQGIRLGAVVATEIRRVAITNTSNEAILWDGATPVGKYGSIESNIISRTGSGVIVAPPDGGFSLAIVNNRISEAVPFGGGAFPGYGIVVQGFGGSVVSGNSVSAARQDGIFLTGGFRGNTISHNTVAFCSGNGIHLGPVAGGNHLLNNNSHSNGTALLATGGTGLLVESSQNVIEGNALNTNLGLGLQFCTANASCDNTFGRNTARNNLGLVAGPCGACGGAPALFPPNSCNIFCGGGASPNSTFGDNLIPGPPVL